MNEDPAGGLQHASCCFQRGLHGYYMDAIPYIMFCYWLAVLVSQSVSVQTIVSPIPYDFFYNWDRYRYSVLLACLANQLSTRRIPSLSIWHSKQTTLCQNFNNRTVHWQLNSDKTVWWFLLRCVNANAWRAIYFFLQAKYELMLEYSWIRGVCLGIRWKMGVFARSHSNGAFRLQ